MPGLRGASELLHSHSPSQSPTPSLSPSGEGTAQVTAWLVAALGLELRAEVGLQVVCAASAFALLIWSRSF